MCYWNMSLSSISSLSVMSSGFQLEKKKKNAIKNYLTTSNCKFSHLHSSELSIGFKVNLGAHCRVNTTETKVIIKARIVELQFLPSYQTNNKFIYFHVSGSTDTA